MFLGAVELSVGQTALESRRLRCVIAMIRDYDDAKVGRVQSPGEAREQLDIDRQDLTLFTRTFFQNVQRFLRTARDASRSASFRPTSARSRATGTPPASLSSSIACKKT